MDNSQISPLPCYSSAMNGDYVSSGSPAGSPLVSPVYSPFGSPHGLPIPENPFQPQFAQQLSLQPPTQNAAAKRPSSSKHMSSTNSNNEEAPSMSPSNSTGHNTFVHKLYDMVVDKQYQHLISWNFTGTSFVVCNITEFSRDVLPKHFKHNNFSSFVRQLNMYGFHKVNKSARGHRSMGESQIWEFSHPKFIHGRPDLLKAIKRKAVDSDMARRENGDLHSRVALMQVSQSHMMQQLTCLQDEFAAVVRELTDVRRHQDMQQQMMETVMDYIARQEGGQISTSSQMPVTDTIKSDPEAQRPPPIYVTSPDVDFTNDDFCNHERHINKSSGSRPSSPLTVQTHNLATNLHPSFSDQSSPVDASSAPSSPHSNSSIYHAAVNTPLPPSPSQSAFMSDDEAASLCSPYSPGMPNNNAAYGMPTAGIDTASMTSAAHHQPQQYPSCFSNNSQSNHIFYSQELQQQQLLTIQHQQPLMMVQQQQQPSSSASSHSMTTVGAQGLC